MNSVLRDALARAIAFSLLLCVPWDALAQSNDNVLEFDFPALRVGVAERDDGPTGTTVFYFPDGVTAAADVRGGAPGTMNVPAVMNGYEDPFFRAVVFSGGSSYGLAAATGAAEEIGRLKRNEGDHDFIAGVLGAIIYDVGGRRFSRVTPDAALGAEAVRAAIPNVFPLGARGAGRFAMQGIYFNQGAASGSYEGWAHSGQGGAFRQVGPTKVAVFTVVNSLGTVVDRQGRVVRCHRNDPDVSCPRIRDLMSSTLSERVSSADLVPGDTTGGLTTNTTLTLVVTNETLSYAELRRLAVQVHTSMGRAIQPFATSADGDVLYAVTTNEVENEAFGRADLEVLASEVAWDAVLSSVPDLPPPPVPSSRAPDPSALRGHAGTYVFPGGSEIEVEYARETLTATYEGRDTIYFGDQVYTLRYVEPGLFMMDSPAEDVIEFGTDGAGTSILTLNPGPWALTATKAL